jgi:hypothetical protein
MCGHNRGLAENKMAGWRENMTGWPARRKYRYRNDCRNTSLAAFSKAIRQLAAYQWHLKSLAEAGVKKALIKLLMQLMSNCLQWLSANQLNES